MKKWIGLFLALMLMLAVSSAFAGGSAEGDITVTDLTTNTVLTGDTILTIDRDGEEQSINGKTKAGDFTLQFVGGGHFLTFSNNSGAAVSAKSIAFQNCHIILPLGGSVKNGTVCNASGSPASSRGRSVSSCRSAAWILPMEPRIWAAVLSSTRQSSRSSSSRSTAIPLSLSISMAGVGENIPGRSRQLPVFRAHYIKSAAEKQGKSRFSAPKKTF